MFLSCGGGCGGVWIYRRERRLGVLHMDCVRGEFLRFFVFFCMGFGLLSWWRRRRGTVNKVGTKKGKMVTRKLLNFIVYTPFG